MTKRRAGTTVEELQLGWPPGQPRQLVASAVCEHGRGQLQAKRLHRGEQPDEVPRHGTEGCNYLLAVDVDMNTVDGYAMSAGSPATATSS